MVLSERVKADEIGAFDTSLLDGTFQVAKDSLKEATFLIRITNTSGVNVLISFDGTTPNDIVLADDYMELNFSASGINNTTNLIAKDSKIYVKQQTIAGAGYVLIACYYQELC